MNSNLPDEDNHPSLAELGAILRAKREHLGFTLEAVAADLKIRNFYLNALEEGQLSRLPGSTYVAGFLRVYSDYLGFDSEEIVGRFKLAGVAINDKTDLQLPSPVEDGLLPSVTVFLVGALILVGAYGGWYLISVDRNKVVQLVVEPPNQTSSVINSPKVKQGGNATFMGPAKPRPTLSEEGRVLPKRTENTVSENLGKNQMAPSSVLSTGASTRLRTHESLATKKKTVLVPLENNKEVSVSNLSEEPRSLRNKTQTPRNLVEKQKTTNPILSAPASVEADTSQTRHNQNLGSGREIDKSNPQTEDNISTASARIVVRATADSFISVRTAENKPLFSQLLRSGDLYEVPSGADFILDTGNAGGLAISIGDKSVPTLGFPGQIRRNIPLNARKLLRGSN